MIEVRQLPCGVRLVMEKLPEISLMRDALLSARVDVGAGNRYSQIASLNTLDRLLSGGYITVSQYIKRLPEGIIADKEELLNSDEQTESRA